MTRPAPSRIERGHRDRTSDIPQRLPDLVADLADEVAPLLDRPWAVFGHSMGATVGHELVRLGGTSSAMLEIPEIRRLALPAVRSDHRLAEPRHAGPGTAP
ncbi:hypothetical protein GCM10010442_46590 [Kitasatospora kifunensis]